MVFHVVLSKLRICLAGLPLDQSAGAENHDTPSIGGFVGLLPLLILASSQDCDTALATAEMLGMDFMEERCHVMYVAKGEPMI